MKVVVVGAGVIGLCTAWSLRRDGHEVTVVDRGPFDGDRASLGNGGIVVPSHFVPLAAPGMVATGLKLMTRRDGPFRIKPSLDAGLAKWCWLFTRHCTEDNVSQGAPLLRDLHLESRGLFESLVEEIGDDFGFERKGLLMTCLTEHGLEEEVEVAHRARELGLQADVLDRDQVQARVGTTRVEAKGAVYFADDAHMAPHVLVRRLQETLEDRGVTFLWNVKAGGVSPEGGLSTPDGPFAYDALVVAAGTWSGVWAKTIGLDMPLQPGKGLNVGLSAPPRPLEMPLLLKEARIAVTPMCGGIRFGGTMELGEWSLEPDTVRAQAMVKNIPAYLPDFPEDLFADVPVWTGLRPCSPDGLPYVGRSQRAQNVVFATGHGMMGLSLGPVTGDMVAREIASPGSCPAALSPDRFDG
ncbi:MAG: FAD-dependent oxidoreductase [Armatimonadetes bacterium]|nr:FAD-dependent oxidoreductase [Armatimonadota bacterium]